MSSAQAAHPLHATASTPSAAAPLGVAATRVDYRTDPSQYRHWKLTFEGPVATLGIDIAEDGGIRDATA